VVGDAHQGFALHALVAVQATGQGQLLSRNVALEQSVALVRYLLSICLVYLYYIGKLIQFLDLAECFVLEVFECHRVELETFTADHLAPFSERKSQRCFIVAVLD
jgi:hypothetical protein